MEGKQISAVNNAIRDIVSLMPEIQEDTADAVIKLYTDKEFYDSCARNAKKLSDDINWENEFKKLIAVEKLLIEAKK